MEPAPYGGLRMVISEANLLTRITDDQRRALAEWVRTGGELAVVGADADELARVPLVRELVPGFEVDTGRVAPVFSSRFDRAYARWYRDPAPQMSPTRNPWSYDAPGLETVSYGSRAYVGLGTVHFILASDALSGEGEGAEARATEAVNDLIDWSSRFLSYGWRGAMIDTASTGMLSTYSWSYDYANEQDAARRLGLDPNLERRLPTWAYLLVVLGFTVTIFLIQRRWSRRGGKVWKRLVATSALVAAVGCLTLFALSWAARGSGARYRSMTWIEAASGVEQGVLWRRLALASDQAGTLELTSEPGLRAAVPYGSYRGEGAGRSVELLASQWQTIIGTEHGVVDLGGTVELEWGRDNVVRRVRNRLDGTLRRAVLVVGNERYDLGDLAPGAGVSVEPEQLGARLPPFVPQRIGWRSEHGQMRAAVVGELDLGCPDRGDFRADGCTTTVVIWGRP